MARLTLYPDRIVKLFNTEVQFIPTQEKFYLN